MVDKVEIEIKRDVNNRVVQRSASGLSNDSDAVAVLGIIRNGEDVSEKIDAKELAHALSDVTIRRAIRSYLPYESSEIVWEIDLLYNNRPLHILLGNFNICYESSDNGVDEIQNPELITQSLTQMITK